MESVDVIIVGAGQAGLALSHELTSVGIDHLVLERDQIGATWRRRWDSFCLVTPNWSVQLPGFAYDGEDPDGFMVRDDIVAYLERYARSFGAPVRTGVAVESVRLRPFGDFVVQTTAGAMRARKLVLATGAYQRVHRLPAAALLPSDLLQVSLDRYRNPEALPSGSVLVIGSGQSGAQIAEELRESGRDVYLSCGRAPWVPRRLAGRDIVWWLADSGVMDQPATALPAPAARLISNPLASGHDGGHDLHLRTLQAMGVTLLGRFAGADGSVAHFAPDLEESVAWGDARYRELMDTFQKHAATRGIRVPGIAEPLPFRAETPESVDLSGFGAVIFTAGFRPDYTSWLPWPEAFDELGFPLHDDGASTVVAGLSFIGVHFLRTRKSSLLLGVGDDARVVAAKVAQGLRSRAA
jgi:putative flavoprotein involved in K+ transport